MTPGPIRILAVDDHTLLRTALCNTLRLDPRLEIVAEAGNGQEAVRAAQVHQPDIVLLDIEMPGQHVAATVRQLAALPRAPEVMILSMYDDRALEQDLSRLGVRAYLHKSVTVEMLTSAICLVAASQQNLSLSVSGHPQHRTLGRPGEAPGTTGPAGTLSCREVEVLHCVSDAMSNRQIASSLGITEGTVKRHLRNIFAKLDAVSRLDAVNKASERGLLAPTSLPRSRLTGRHRPAGPRRLAPASALGPAAS